ncbi:hypothetical protein HMPREF9715_03107 [Myroides odoratimimus CIP 101113]|uniref:Uncharacterized protein n=1 Tax=Myroides odoratimimus CIP 101113 TaxID=883154 RepID=A0AAV3F0H9_9FLAO|nr:hypothetical protein HMPREF9715_03107 [Myroides odoratimimus CIP 101113]
MDSNLKIIYNVVRTNVLVSLSMKRKLNFVVL